MRPGAEITLSTFTRFALNGVFTTSARTPIVNGRGQPATSYGGRALTGVKCWGSSRALACAREGWAIGPTSEPAEDDWASRSEEHTTELQSRVQLRCRLLL